ncbi:LysE family translocator [Aliiroseovarius lamellibrachiae]|uniref:LysE family translocator n=1 Tax=Aliiroseovarius lamellibrachiae TaxID=1924933 RepID=UPI001BE028D2|nr:LysE family translocator [Aliiroseovarius lamellibrachiae]MBT2129550.1 LysE family translocator [Aliiroseovarius lamellibrachiae]
MDLLTSLVTYALALGIAAAIPGPGIAALVGQAMGGSLRNALVFILGIACGDVVYLTIAVAGLAAVAKSFAGAMIVLKLLGGLYLAYLAYQFWTSDPKAPEMAKSRKYSTPKTLLSAFTITISNPKAIIFYLALVPSVLDLNAVGVSEWGLLVLVSVIVLFAVMTPYALLANKAGRVLARSSTLKTMNRWAAAFIGTAGLLMIAEAGRALRRAT